MKQGLLLKEAPEPIRLFNCQYTGGSGCNEIFFNQFDYKKHRKEVHAQVYTYDLEPAYYSKYSKTWASAFLVERWIKLENYKGQMIAQLPESIRPVRRFFYTEKELENLKNKVCFCGKKLPKRRRKYCSDECSYNWNYKKSTVWSLFRSNYLHDAAISKKTESWGSYEYKWKCTECDKIMDIDNHVEVDHIIAITLGGHPWDYRNLQILCYFCHKIKTKSDMGILAWWRKESNYEATFTKNYNYTIDSFFENAF